MLRVIAGSDFHYPRRVRTLEPFERMAASDADVLILAGDIVDTFDPVSLMNVFEATRAFAGPRLYVWGNHELWSRVTPARKLHDEALPALARAGGFHPLETDGPVFVGDVAFVGVMGWYAYEYALRDSRTDGEILDARVQNKKIEIRRTGRSLADLTDDDYATKEVSWYEDGRVRTASWQDGEKARWGTETDADILGQQVDTLRTQLAEAAARAKRIVGITHMVPSEAGLHEPDGFWRTWFRAFMGSPSLGAAFDAEPKTHSVVFGHCHRGKSFSTNGWRAYNVASPSGRSTTFEVEA